MRELNRAKNSITKNYFEEDSMDQEIYAKVKEIVAELLDIDESEITPESKFQADLGADSLDLVELIMEFEERFGGEISDEDAQSITTVGEAVKYVETHM
jgi:acyl carrier protein